MSASTNNNGGCPGPAERDAFIIGPDDPILVTGASGFIGSRVVVSLLDFGFRNLRCLIRSSSRTEAEKAFHQHSRKGVRIEVVSGNLLSNEDCSAATKDVKVIYHLAAGRGEKSFPDAFMNSVVTTRNLVEAALQQGTLTRFVNISSFTVYTNTDHHRGRVLDESSPVEEHPEARGDAYTYAKVKQDELVTAYGKEYGLPYVMVRPGYVYGPGNHAITGRVGIDTFGVFLHLGGSNRIPFTYVDNCADLIVLAGLKRGIEGETFNVVDDNLPSSRQFLRRYKRDVRRFKSLYVPHFVSYGLCYLWERYSTWSQGQLPPTFNRKRWYVDWKRTRYSNHKAKTLLGWTPGVSTEDGLKRYFEACRNGNHHA